MGPAGRPPARTPSADTPGFGRGGRPSEPEGRLSVCAVWRGRRLAAVLPLWRSGGAVRAMSNVHTPVFQVPACDDLAHETAISAAAPGGPRRLEVEALGFN